MRASLEMSINPHIPNFPIFNNTALPAGFLFSNNGSVVQSKTISNNSNISFANPLFYNDVLEPLNLTVGDPNSNNSFSNNNANLGDFSSLTVDKNASHNVFNGFYQFNSSINSSGTYNTFTMSSEEGNIDTTNTGSNNTFNLTGIGSFSNQGNNNQITLNDIPFFGEQELSNSGDDNKISLSGPGLEFNEKGSNNTDTFNSTIDPDVSHQVGSFHLFSTATNDTINLSLGSKSSVRLTQQEKSTFHQAMNKNNKIEIDQGDVSDDITINSGYTAKKSANGDLVITDPLTNNVITVKSGVTVTVNGQSTDTILKSLDDTSS